MNRHSQTLIDAYRDELRLLTDAMSVTHDAAPRVEVDSQAQLDHFALENFDKRLDKLKSQVEFIQEAFADPDDLFKAFTLAQPMAAYDRQNSDGAAFLDWLAGRGKLTRTQKDYITVARSRLRIEEIASVQRGGHLRFQELYSVAGTLLPELGTNARLRLIVNPVWHRARLRTGTFLEGEKPPVEVVFFAHGSDVRTAMLGEFGLELLEELARIAPCTLGVWASVSDTEREELIQFARQLVELGLAALG